MKEISKFQIAVLAVFILLGLVGVAVFALQKSGSGSQATPITVWGILPQSDLLPTIDELQTSNKNTFSVTYTYIDKADFASKLVNALATGEGPDAVLISQDIFLSIKDLLYPIPYANYSERTFEDSFAQAGEVYLSTAGVYGLPVAIDPLLMYWNRDIVANAGYAEAPKTWTDILLMAQKLTIKGADGSSITQSAIDLGGWNNIPYAKSILASLMFQGGNSIIATDASGKMASDLNLRTTTAGIAPAQEALLFYTQFADPSKDIYSWNNALPSADAMFTNGTLAFYFAPASDAATIRSENPNLNFDVAPVPEADASHQAAFADVYAFSLLKNSPSLAPALGDIVLLTGMNPSSEIVNAVGIAPARRDSLSVTPGDAYKATFWQSAITAKTWTDPDETTTDGIFSRMVQSVTSGAASVSDAVNTANSSLQTLLLSQ